MNIHKAIYTLYPQTVRINEKDKIEAFDADGNLVAYDETAVQAYIDAHSYIAKRIAEYPPFTDYLDGIAKADQAQIDKYIADCQAVKTKYPKP